MPLTCGFAGRRGRTRCRQSYQAGCDSRGSSPWGRPAGRAPRSGPRRRLAEGVVAAPQDLALAVAPLGGPDGVVDRHDEHAAVERHGRAVVGRGGARPARPAVEQVVRASAGGAPRPAEEPVERRPGEGRRIVPAAGPASPAPTTGSGGRQRPVIRRVLTPRRAVDTTPRRRARRSASTRSTCSGTAPGGRPAAEVSSAWPGGRAASSASARPGSSSENTSSSSSTGAVPGSRSPTRVGGQAQGQRQRALLALAGVGAGRQAADGERQLVAVRARRASTPRRRSSRRPAASAAASPPSRRATPTRSAAPTDGPGLGADGHRRVRLGEHRAPAARTAPPAAGPAPRRRSASLSSHTSRVSAADSSRRPAGPA